MCPWSERRTSNQYGRLFSLAIVVLVAVSGVAVSLTFVGATSAHPSYQAQQSANATADLTFTNHTTYGSTVVVRNANLSEGGFVILREQAPNGPIIGVSEYLEPGSQENVRIQLFNVSGENFTRSRLNQSTRLVASAHLDTNDNEQFEYLNNRGDRPYRQANTRPVTNDAFVSVIGTAEQARTNPTGDLTFTGQSAINGVVSVREANLSEGGFIVITDPSARNGSAVSSVVGVSGYLEPGNYTDVRIPLAVPGQNNSSAAELAEGDQTLLATAKLDTNNNQQFDYVATNGTADVAYLQDDGSPIYNPSTIEVPAAVADGSTTPVPATGSAAANATGQSGANGTTTGTVTDRNATTSSPTTGQSPATTSAGTTQGAQNEGGSTTTETTGPGFGLTSALIAVLTLATVLRLRARD